MLTALTPFFIGSFCSPKTQDFQKNNSFSFFSPKNLEIHDANVVVLLEFIGIINET